MHEELPIERTVNRVEITTDPETGESRLAIFAGDTLVKESPVPEGALERFRAQLLSEVRACVPPPKMKGYFRPEGDIPEAPKRVGFLTVNVLPELVGRQFDEAALGMIHSLRPSIIRVSRGEVLCDAFAWRVTVWVTPDDQIIEVTQEVEVGLPRGVQHGGHLRHLIATTGRAPRG
jgi:hypothetical protein